MTFIEALTEELNNNESFNYLFNERVFNSEVIRFAYKFNILKGETVCSSEFGGGSVSTFIENIFKSRLIDKKQCADITHYYENNVEVIDNTDTYLIRTVNYIICILTCASLFDIASSKIKNSLYDELRGWINVGNEKAGFADFCISVSGRHNSYNISSEIYWLLPCGNNLYDFDRINMGTFVKSFKCDSYLKDFSKQAGMGIYLFNGTQATRNMPEPEFKEDLTISEWAKKYIKLLNDFKVD